MALLSRSVTVILETERAEKQNKEKQGIAQGAARPFAGGRGSARSEAGLWPAEDGLVLPSTSCDSRMRSGSFVYWISPECAT